ncbi:hypothetical protein ACQKP3_19625 [Vibrio sp. DNB22_10_4]
MRIVFVLSGKPYKGLGHIMRCRLLAQALQEEGCTVEFLFDELSTKHRPFVEPFSFVCCQHKARSANEQLIDALFEYTQQSPIDWVVLDDYEFDLDLEQAITELGAKLAVFDDILRQHRCDVLIDSRWCGETTYDNYDSSEIAQKLLGPTYACIAQSPQVDPDRKGNPSFKVMMSLGGGGDLLLLKPYLDVLLEDSNSVDIEFQVVIGPFATNAEMLMARYISSPNIEFIQGAVDLTSYLANIDFYIGAAGGTLLQMLAHRIPSLTFSIASNQDNNLEHLTQLGHPLHFNQGDDVDVAFLPLFIAAARKHYHRLVSSIENAPVQIDFRGAKRISEVMLGEGVAIPMSASPKSANKEENWHSLGDGYRLRAVKDSDIRHYLDSRNLAQNQNNMLSKHRIDLLAHTAWWLGSERHSFLLEKNSCKLLYIWHQKVSISEKDYLIGGWFVCGGELQFQDSIVALQWQLKTCDREFPNVPWIAVIQKDNDFVNLLNRYVGFALAEPEKHHYQAIKTAFSGAEEAQFNFVYREGV